LGVTAASSITAPAALAPALAACPATSSRDAAATFTKPATSSSRASKPTLIKETSCHRHLRPDHSAIRYWTQAVDPKTRLQSNRSHPASQSTARAIRDRLHDDPQIQN